MSGGYLDPGREDLRLFQEGPPDPFVSLGQWLEGEINPYWNTDGEQIDEPEDWRLDTLPVNTPEGEPQGYAVELVTGPSAGPDGTFPPLPDEPLWLMDVAHFESRERAEEFAEAFHEHLVPGLLEGPDLAAEIARLEGLPGEQRLLDGPTIEEYANGKLTLTRDAAEWHIYGQGCDQEKAPQQVVGPELETASPEFDL